LFISSGYGGWKSRLSGREVREVTDITLYFRFCHIELHKDEREARTIFHDGKIAVSCPNDTRDHPDPKAAWWQHAIWHILCGELRGVPSDVLWAHAHGEDAETFACQQEEAECVSMERAMQMRPKWPR
jgi:hypothetical protein